MIPIYPVHHNDKEWFDYPYKRNDEDYIIEDYIIKKYNCSNGNYHSADYSEEDYYNFLTSAKNDSRENGDKKEVISM